MEYKALYRKYRPSNFDNIVDQEFIIKTLKNAISGNKVAHAYIFSGPRGTGKTSTAKVFAKSLNCENYKDGPCEKCQSCLNFNINPDIIEIDAASNNGVDDIRELINNVRIAPSNSKYKIYIIDEVHMLTISAFNALLLTLEEPPENVVFILATTNIESVPITILSRCQRFDFKKINQKFLIERLKYISKEEKIAIEDDAIFEICLLADGGLRDAIGILDQLSSQNNNITLETVQKSYNIVNSKLINEIVSSFVDNDKKTIICKLDEIENNGYDFKTVNKKIINGFYNYIINNDSNFENIKKIILELNKLMSDINIYISPYLLLKTILITNINNNIYDTKVNKLDNKKIPLKEKINNENYFPGNNFDEQLEKLKEIRINNVFVNPTKQELKDKQEKWEKFKNELNDSSILSLLIDSKVVVSSEKYSVIQTELEATSHLINMSILKIENLFNEKYNTNIKLISITNDEWRSLKSEYVKNTKNNKKYSIVEEIKMEYNEEELKTILGDVFKKSKIEVE